MAPASNASTVAALSIFESIQGERLAAVLANPSIVQRFAMARRAPASRHRLSDQANSPTQFEHHFANHYSKHLKSAHTRTSLPIISGCANVEIEPILQGRDRF
jgi:hypothetical protein